MLDKLEALKDKLRDMESVVVAYSGGVDSSFLLKVAQDVLGDRAQGVLAVSPLLPSYEQEEAAAIAAEIKADVDFLEKDDLRAPAFVENTPDRCYVCKAAICAQLKAYAREKGYRFVVDGSNIDDRGDYRPGQRAARECGMRSPLQEVDLTKAEIRSLARRMGLPNWDKPASACLASRIPYGTPITREALEQVGEAEWTLRQLGLRQLRVRHHDNVARIEVPVKDFDLIMAHRDGIVAALKGLGYAYVTLDLRGFRSGSMNEVIEEVSKTHGHRKTT